MNLQIPQKLNYQKKHGHITNNLFNFLMTLPYLASDGDNPIGQPQGQVHSIIGPGTATDPTCALKKKKCVNYLPLTTFLFEKDRKHVFYSSCMSHRRTKET